MAQHDQQPKEIPISNPEQPASDKSISRKEFVALVLKRGAIAGAILSAPKVLDKFLVPPASATSSTVVHGHLT